MTIDGIEYLDPETINGLNLYAYCNNNPVMYVDPDGNKWWHWLIGAIVIIGLGVATAFTGGAAGVIFPFPYFKRMGIIVSLINQWHWYKRYIQIIVQIISWVNNSTRRNSAPTPTVG